MASVNIRFPLTDDNDRNGLFTLNELSRDALTSNLVLLLLTRKGERYYQPDYGTNLLQYVFEPNDSITIDDIEEEVRSTVKSFIPQLNINRIEFYRNEGSNGDKLKDTEINIEIDFTFKDDVFSERGTLTLTI